jgi:hypothetical protein
MNLFRSGEHIRRWLAGRQPGETIPVPKLSELAHAWWEDRLSPGWRPHTRDANQAILDRLGLAGDFWRLPHSLPAAEGRPGCILRHSLTVSVIMLSWLLFL